MSKNASGIGCAVQLGIFALIVIGGLLILQSVLNLPASIFNAPPPTPTTVTLPPALDVINKQPRLQTAAYTLSTVADARQKVGLLQQEQRVLLVACGKVTAGIDLSKLTSDNAQTNGERVTIQLPPAEIFDALLIEDADPPCTYVAFRSDGILLEAAKDLETIARRQVIETFQQSALDQGILYEATQNAQTELRRLLFAVGYKAVDFKP